MRFLTVFLSLAALLAIAVPPAAALPLGAADTETFAAARPGPDEAEPSGRENGEEGQDTPAQPAGWERPKPSACLQPGPSAFLQWELSACLQPEVYSCLQREPSSCP